LIDSVSNDLIHLIWDSTVSSWQTQTIELPSDQKKDVQEYISYSTDASFRDAAGAPLVNTPVTVWASDPTILSVNGVTQLVDAHRKASLTTNSTGQLSITQETDSLGVPALKFNIPALMDVQEIGTIEQYADGPKSVETRLKGVTTDELKNAKDHGGHFLLKETVRDDDASLGALQSSFQSLMRLPDRETQRAGTRHPLLARQGPRDGVHIGSPEAALDRLRVAPRRSPMRKVSVTSRPSSRRSRCSRRAGCWRGRAGARPTRSSP
jgi:hypothetical protein